jgi:hypothetical protein
VRRGVAAVALVLVLVLGLAVGWIGANTLTGDDEEVADGDALTVPAAEERGAAGLLPAPVAQTRAQLLAAAEAGDYDALAGLAPEDFSYTFGEPPEGGPAEYWRELEQTTDERPMETLAGLLRLPYTLHAGFYTWPFAFDTPLDELTDYERELLSETVDVEGAYAAGVGYADWRVGIEPDGTWRFFISGD